MVKRSVWFGYARRWSLLAAAGAMVTAQTAMGSALVRWYQFGEDDFNLDDEPAGVGDLVAFAEDSIPLEGDVADPVLSSAIGREPLYVEGRTGPGSLAIEFDGEDDNLLAQRMRPHGGPNFATFSVSVQVWLKPDIEAQGRNQVIFRNATNYGSAVILENGNWGQILTTGGNPLGGALIPGATNVDEDFGPGKLLDTGVPVNFGEWNHIATLVTGGSHLMYINGSAVTRVSGTYGGNNEPLIVGSNLADDALFFDGTMDDLQIHVQGGRTPATADIPLSPISGWVPEFELDYWVQQDQPFSGIAGDVNQDAIVDQDDYEIWRLNAGFDNGLDLGDPGLLLRGDVTGDGAIDGQDLTAIIREAQAGGNAITVVPEPASVLLLVGGASCLVRRRR